jgi:hypothetical protein
VIYSIRKTWLTWAKAGERPVTNDLLSNRSRLLSREHDHLTNRVDA